MRAIGTLGVGSIKKLLRLMLAMTALMRYEHSLVIGKITS